MTTLEKGDALEPVLVDVGWRGPHGIGRYSHEILQRLSVPWTALSNPGTPGTPLNLLLPRQTSSRSWIYSPGYNAGLSKSRQAVTVHDLIHLESASKKYQGYYSAILKPAIKKAGLVFTVSETSRNAIHEWLADDSVEVVVATNGCSDEFSPARRRDAEQGYLLFVGNTKPHKNLTTLLKALALLRDVKLVAVTPNVDLVRRAAAALGVSDRVRVLSDVDDRDLAELYANAGATVVPSLIEGFGLPALESICSGTPVVYWRGCESVAEIVGRMGIACDAASSAEEWSDALSRVLANPPKVDPVLARYTHSWDASAQIVSQRLADLAR